MSKEINPISTWKKLCPQIYQKVFDHVQSFSEEYLTKISKVIPVEVKNSAFFLKNNDDPYVSSSNNMRTTVKQPKKAEHTIHMLGSSYLYGTQCEDRETIASYIQKFSNIAFHGKYIVKNYGLPAAQLVTYVQQLQYLPIAEGDIVIIYTGHLSRVAHSSFTQDDQYDVNSEEVIMYLYFLCCLKKAKFHYIIHPALWKMTSPSSYERFLMNNKDTSKFLAEYKNFCKGIINNNVEIATDYTEPSIISILKSKGCPCLDTQIAVNRPHKLGEIYLDTSHISAKGNRAVAKYIFEHCISALDSHVIPTEEEQKELFKNLDRKKVEQLAHKNFAGQLRFQYAKNKSINTWLSTIEQDAFSTNTKIGAIIMNCNPFTKGHLYLIENALTYVDNLYIFAVEEDRSDFPFVDRIKLMKEGTAHLGGKVKIFPSGNFIISAMTFPDYFEKSHAKETIKVDSSNDIAIFGAVIASRLNIAVRFVGEEPTCIVTKQYNETMKQLLPSLGVGLVEIPRIGEENSKAGSVISASRVRALLKENNWEEIEQLVPPTTLSYLKARENS